jgi:hypothetical protein
LKKAMLVELSPEVGPDGSEQPRPAVRNADGLAKRLARRLSSLGIVPDTSIIYVELVGEAVDVWRPVAAIVQQPGIYRLPDEPPDAETWAFAPGSLVRCELRSLSGGRELVGCALAE